MNITKRDSVSVRGEKMSFDKLDLIPPIREALKTEGYTIPTEIQEQAIPPLLEGRDLLGCAQTGTGKTADKPEVYQPASCQILCA